MPSSPQMDALVRALTAIFVGYLMKLGIDEANALAIAAGLGAVLLLGWGYWANKLPQLIKSVTSQPEVEEVRVDDQELADSLDAKVVGPEQAR